MASAAVFVAMPITASADPSHEYEETVDAFRRGDCHDARDRASALLYPTPRVADAGELARLHLLLGACYLEEFSQPVQAEREFEEALSIDARLEPGPLFSQRVTEVFRKKREELERRAAAEAEKATLAQQRDQLLRIYENMVFLEKRRYWVNFIPFGAGQFQNGDRKKGVFFLSSQAFFGGLSVALFGYQVSQYGFSGQVPLEEIRSVNRLRMVQIASGFAFFGLVGWGIADSLLNYEHTVSRRPDPKILEELEEFEEIRRLPGSSSTLKLFPAGGPDWAGVGLSWEF